MSNYIIVSGLPPFEKTKSIMYWALWAQLSELFPGHAKIQLVKHGSAIIRYKTETARHKDLSKSGSLQVVIRDRTYTLKCAQCFEVIYEMTIKGLPEATALSRELCLPPRPWVNIRKS